MLHVEAHGIVRGESVTIQIEIIAYIASVIVGISAAAAIIHKLVKRMIVSTTKEAISTAVTEAGSNLHGEIKSLRNSLEEYVAKNTADNELMKQSLLAIARDRISKAHSQCMRDGYISKYLLLALEELYATYAKLGGNSFVSREMQDLRQLPLMSTDKLQQLSERR